MISDSELQTRSMNGRSWVLRLMTALGGWSAPAGYTTVMLLSWPAKASAFPEGEKATLWIQPAVLFMNSPHTVLKGSLSPQTEASGLASTPLTNEENTRACPSVEPAASRTEFGCQATVVMVLRI